MLYIMLLISVKTLTKSLKSIQVVTPDTIIDLGPMDKRDRKKFKQILQTTIKLLD